MDEHGAFHDPEPARVMDVWTAVQAQRAVRSFDGRLLPPNDLECIVDAGRLSPSSNNEQRWAFITCTNREHLRKLSKTGEYAGHLAEAGAAVALIVPKGGQDWEPQSIAYDLGQASQSMMLVAWERGIGSVHAAVYDEPLTRSLLGYPETWRCDYLISFGYPLSSIDLTAPKSPDARKPANETVHRERW